MSLKITMAGVDITSHVKIESIQAKDILGQGAGTNATRTGRAATCEFLTDLGPANSAVGSGTRVTSPTLVRKGEVVITDIGTNIIFGGYVSTLTDRTDKVRNFTLVDCVDYWQSLDEIAVLETYSGVSDVYIIRDLLTKYAPWISQFHIPKTGSYTFTVKVFKSITLQKALAAITDITGYQIWIDNNKTAYYTLPTLSINAPFKLSSDPDNQTSFPLGVDDNSGLVIDDTATINRVTFFGGKDPSNDFTQDLSTQANGSNRLFVLAYYPRVPSSGQFEIQSQNINGGSNLSYGYLLGRGTQNQFRSNGGTADVLLNSDARTLMFDPGLPAPANSGAGSVTITYRYEFPMIIQLTDPVSFKFYGKYYDGFISDQTVFDRNTAVARCRVILSEQSKGLTTLKLKCWKGGLQAGHLLNVYHSTRNINGTYMIQEVDTVALGNGLFEYTITCGAWNYNVVDSIVASTSAAYKAQLAPINDSTNGQDTVVIQILQPLQDKSIGIHSTWGHTTRTWGHYYARTAAVGDGHDAYAGLCSIAS